ncbi:MAG: hypothetical protein K2W78_00235 [Xanthobacteraceae bacterium]|nr:hypothetical protein [Xanthobacteraceae bacterium]
MLTNVPLRDFKDFKPDVVICPHCTQRLMAVRDIRWGADKVEFTYGCDGCGNELDKPIVEDVLPAPTATPAKASRRQPAAASPLRQDVPAPAVEDLGTFPFKPEPAKAIPAKPEAPAVNPERHYTPRQAFIEDRAARSPRQVFDAAPTVVEKDAPTVASRASVLLRDVNIFNL